MGEEPDDLLEGRRAAGAFAPRSLTRDMGSATIPTAAVTRIRCPLPGAMPERGRGRMRRPGVYGSGQIAFISAARR